MATEQHTRPRGADDSKSTTRNRRASNARPRCVPLEHLRARLGELVRNLRLARCALLIATQVVEAQKADHVADIVQVLRHDIGARLDSEIDAAEELLASTSDGKLKEAA